MLAVQVKRSPLPLRFARAAWQRMQADAHQYGWRWLVGQVEPDGHVRLLDPSKAKTRGGVTLTEAAELERPLEWLRST